MLKITYYIASAMNNSDFSDSQFLEKMQKQIHKLPKCFANCELQMTNSNRRQAGYGRHKRKCLGQAKLKVIMSSVFSLLQE